MQKLQGFSEAGNTTLAITGSNGVITRKVTGSFPAATVTVYINDPPAVSISSITRASNIVTVTIPSGSNFIAGETVTIAGVTDSSFNGTFTIITSGATTFTYAQVAANASSSGGTADSNLRLANIYSDNNTSPTAKANPFISATDGTWYFYASNGRYDVRFSGGGITIPFTLSDFSLFDESIIFIDVTATPYNAVGDGVTNNDAALAAAMSAVGSTGAIVYFPPGSYKTTRTFVISKSNLEILFANGAEILFQPTVVGAGADRAVLVHCGDSVIGGNVNVTGSIALEATSFVAASTAGISVGDWLMLQETDAGTSSGTNIVVFSYVQVLSVVGTTINTVSPINRAFPATHSTVFFNRISNSDLTQNVILRNVRARTTDASNGLVGFSIVCCRNVTLENCISLPRNGNGYASFRTSNLRVINCTQSQQFGQGTEFASCDGLIVDGLISDTASGSYQADTSALVLDFGTGSFMVMNCRLGGAANIAVQLVAVSYGAFVNNVINSVLSVAAFNTLGIIMLGCEYVTVFGNALIGGGGVSSIGVSAASTSGYVANITSQGNQIILNTITGFASRYGTKLDTDLYLDTFSSNILDSNGIFASTRGSPGTSFQAARTGDVNPRITINRDGTIVWSDGTTTDMLFGRNSPNLLYTDKNWRADGYVLLSTGDLTLVNGANNNIVLPTQNYLRVAGPTGAFSISGFTLGAQGRVLDIYVTVAQTLTITNDAISTAENRILTLTGADVSLTGPCFVTLIYDANALRWILKSTRE